ncbi:MAG: metallophosphoesterase family protein [Candidatus Omnitrophica bacterium]|nr:metallophosphoesterase family protein [Candidatus Omnitrophota bacterium]
MRIVVISDTHLSGSDLKLPDKLTEEIKNADMVVHAGDFVEEEFLEKLKGIAKEVKAVYGNMDSAELKRKLPEKNVFRVGRFKIGISHGSGAPGNLVAVLTEFFKDDHPDLILFGHSHAAFNEKIGDTIFFNPGSPFDKIFAKYNSYGIIDINDKIEARIVKFQND